MEYYRRHLPHFHPLESTFFITFRLTNSLPQRIIRQLQDDLYIETLLLQKETKNTAQHHQKYFEHFDRFLDAQKEGNRWLQEPAVAEIVADAIKYRNGHTYDLLCFCIMPNHVHMLIKITREHVCDNRERRTNVTSVLQSLKSFTAIMCNKKIGRTGQFWQRESYDRRVRNDDELERTIRYIIYNPVSAGLVKDWRDWRFTYCSFMVE